MKFRILPIKRRKRVKVISTVKFWQIINSKLIIECPNFEKQEINENWIWNGVPQDNKLTMSRTLPAMLSCIHVYRYIYILLMYIFNFNAISILTGFFLIWSDWFASNRGNSLRLILISWSAYLWAVDNCLQFCKAHVTFVEHWIWNTLHIHINHIINVFILLEYPR